MFAPMSPMGERLRFQNEAHELAQHSARRSQFKGSSASRRQLAFIRRALASFATATQTLTRTTQFQPRLADCPELGQEC